MSYLRLKKFRELNKYKGSHGQLHEDQAINELNYLVEDADYVESDSMEVEEITKEVKEFLSLNNHDSDHEERMSNEKFNNTSLREKLKIWAIENSSDVSNSAVTKLLLILRDEGFADLPSTAITLKKSKETINIRSIMDENDMIGKFWYTGLKKGLEIRIIKDYHKNGIIKVFVNVDGMKVYNKARITFWPILVRINNSLYDGKATVFPVGIFCGSGKPTDVHEFMKEFIEEANDYIDSGIEIDSVNYKLEITGFICDTPARSFLKCTKGHTGFHSCERCDVEGITIDRRRVFTDLDCEKRTHESFVLQKDPDHHLPGVTSPLLKLHNFDIVNGFLLDSMHLLFAGIMNNMLYKIYEPKGFCRLNRSLRSDLKVLFEEAATSISAEFQRKVFCLNDLANWKTSQFRVCLLYLAPIVFKYVLPDKQYKHFLLLHFAVRILMHPKLCIIHCERAKKLLRKFVKLMPSFYGEACQVGNVHNLAHVADDVALLKMPLSKCDAFPFESYLGKLRRMVHSSKEPLVQIARKLNELDDVHNDINGREKLFSKTKTLKGIELRDFVLKAKAPNNVFKRSNGKYYEIVELIASEGTDQSEYLLMKLTKLNIIGDLYEYPYSSKEVGFFEVERAKKKIKKIKIGEIINKCLFFKVRDQLYLSELLH